MFLPPFIYTYKFNAKGLIRFGYLTETRLKIIFPIGRGIDDGINYKLTDRAQ